MAKSDIQWTDWTWNPAVGCDKVDADCKYCYMYRESLKGTRYNPKAVRKTKTVFNLPLKIQDPALVFTSSLTDFFHEGLDDFREECWDIMRRCPHLTFQVLTKRPENIAARLPHDWGQGWPNVWLGTSIGSPKALHRAWGLLSVPAQTYFLSLEPLHEPIDLQAAGLLDRFDGKPLIDWVIVGGESGNESRIVNGKETQKYRYRPCYLDWLERIVTQCQGADLPVFVKQTGTHLSKALRLKDRHGGDIEEWPASIRVRQFPHHYDYLARAPRAVQSIAQKVG